MTRRTLLKGRERPTEPVPNTSPVPIVPAAVETTNVSPLQNTLNENMKKHEE